MCFRKSAMSWFEYNKYNNMHGAKVKVVFLKFYCLYAANMNF